MMVEYGYVIQRDWSADDVYGPDWFRKPVIDVVGASLLFWAGGRVLGYEERVKGRARNGKGTSKKESKQVGVTEARARGGKARL
jgi:hypothetical protein